MRASDTDPERLGTAARGPERQEPVAWTPRRQRAVLGVGDQVQHRKNDPPERSPIRTVTEPASGRSPGVRQERGSLLVLEAEALDDVLRQDQQHGSSGDETVDR